MEKILLSGELWRALELARSKDDTKEALQGLHITKDHIETTNGRILLRASRYGSINIEIPTGPGVYKVIAANKTGAGLVELIIDKLDLDYPETDRVIPAAGKAADLKDVFIARDSARDPFNMASAILKLFKYSGGAFSMLNVSTLAPLAVTWGLTIPAKRDGTEAVRLDHTSGSTHYTAVILPFSLS